MNKFILAMLLILTFCGIKSANAQEQLDSIPPSGNDLIQKGTELFDNGKYDDAIKLFNRVNPCDPNYARACYETALAYDNLDNYTSAMQKCEETILLNPDDVQSGILKGSLLDEMTRRKEAIAWLEILEKKCPYNQNLLYNLAICYLNNGEPLKAEEILLKGLHYNPYHTSSHIVLAKINYIMGRKAQSYLAYNMGILMNPRFDYIKRLEEEISGKNDSISKSYLYPYPKNVEHLKWDNLTGLLNSEVAFRDNFPYDYKLSVLSCRQSFLLFQKMEFDEKDTTLYNQFYVRFFKKMLENKEFETFLNYSLKNSDNKSVSEWLKNNNALLDSFVNHAKANINLWESYGFSTANEARHQKMFHFSDKGVLESIGILTDGPKPSKEGPWRMISENGAISQIGHYQNNQSEGEFINYYPNGSIKQQLNFKNDAFDKLNYTYHPNGAKSGVYPRNKGISNGVEEEYNSAHQLISKTPYKDGIIDGILLFINYDKGFIREIPFVHNKREGMLTERWLNFNKKTQALYTDSLLKGPYKKWYANGHPEWEGNYEKDTLSGKYISYYGNGSKREEGTYDKKGNNSGIYTEFDHQGLPKSQISGYKNGKPDGIQTYYLPNGKVQASMALQEDVYKHIDCFNLSGENIYSADEKEGVLNYKYFFPEGDLKIEGKFKNGTKDGLWKSYSIHGKVISEENWVGGYQSGLQKYYHENGYTQLEYVTDSNKISGKIIKHYGNGHPSLVGYNNKEGYTGEWKSYYSNDSLETRSYFVKGTIAGRELFYSPDGKLTIEETYNEEGEPVRLKYFDVEGKLTDDLNFPYDSVELKLHFPNGKLRARLVRSDRKYNGLQEYYFPNGQLKSQQTYIHGNLQGVSKEWDHHGNLVDVKNYCMNDLDGKTYGYENGKLSSIDTYEMGINQGLYQEFYPNGHVLRTCNYEAGERQGNSDCFAPDSTWMYGIQYRDDQICSVSYLDIQGKLHNAERVTQANKEVVCYYKGGKVCARIPFSKGIYNGKHVIYYPNGQLLREVNFANDYREGVSKYCYENGQIKEFSNWQNGYKTGHYTSFFPNGKKQTEGEYLADKKLGKWSEYNETGKLVETLYYADDVLYEIK